jgi:hypothetical protein
MEMDGTQGQSIATLMCRLVSIFFFFPAERHFVCRSAKWVVVLYVIPVQVAYRLVLPTWTFSLHFSMGIQSFYPVKEFYLLVVKCL